VCWFITVGVPDRHRGALELAIETRRDLFFSAAEGADAAAFPPGSRCVLVTVGGCSCDLYRDPLASPSLDLAKERARLARKGWPPAKIERALGEKQHSAERPVPPRSAMAAFDDFLAGVCREAGAVQVLARFKGGQEPADAPATGTMKLASFISDGFPRDTVVTVRATH
jgi:hypothetical protein